MQKRLGRRPFRYVHRQVFWYHGTVEVDRETGGVPRLAPMQHVPPPKSIARNNRSLQSRLCADTEPRPEGALYFKRVTRTS